MISPVHIIRNPVSGRGLGSRAWPQIETLLRIHFQVMEVHETNAQKAAIHLAQFVAKNTGLVVAVGGDGTLGEVAAGLVGSKATLAVIPVGTGNDFCRTLGFGPDYRRAVTAIALGHTKKIDVIEWQCGGRTGYAINACGCGFDAVVAERINKGYRSLRGTSAYLAGVLQSLATYKAVPLKLAIDGKIVEAPAMLCAITNACTYGGGMRVAPNACIDDGLMDVILVREIGRLGFLRAFPSVFKGTHLTHPKVSSWQATEVEIESAVPLPVLADGELIGETPVRFKILPEALTIIAPAEGPPVPRT